MAKRPQEPPEKFAASFSLPLIGELPFIST